MLNIAIEEITDKNKKDYCEIVGDYSYEITYDGSILASGTLIDVLKVRELNAIISCLDTQINGDMFDK